MTVPGQPNTAPQGQPQYGQQGQYGAPAQPQYGTPQQPQAQSFAPTQPYGGQPGWSRPPAQSSANTARVLNIMFAIAALGIGISWILSSFFSLTWTSSYSSADYSTPPLAVARDIFQIIAGLGLIGAGVLLFIKKPS